jgi:uracil-DNA glycosylase
MYSIEGWDDFFIGVQDAIVRMANTLRERSTNASVSIDPSEDKILRAFKLCPHKDLKVVILGEKPYAGKISTGIAFSVENGVMTPSLEVIAKWLGQTKFDPDLRRWCRQGVLLINAELTIEQGSGTVPHKVLWEEFIRECISFCGQKKDIVFMFFGKVAAEYAKDVKEGNKVLKELHPAAVARWGENRKTKVFTEANEYLISKGKQPIQW